MKNISLQYQDLQEGKMTKHQFLRNARMMFPNHVTQFNSFEDSVQILKTRGLLNEGNAVKGTPDKAPTYDYPNEETKYMKVVQEPEVDEQDGIYPATTLTDIPKEKMDKKVKDKSDGLEPIKDKDTKNEMKKIRIVKESKKALKEIFKFYGGDVMWKGKDLQIDSYSTSEDEVGGTVKLYDKDGNEYIAKIAYIKGDGFNLDIEVDEQTIKPTGVNVHKSSALKENKSSWELNGKPIDIKTVDFEDIYAFDYPDFSDAYISYLEYEDGTPLTDDELEEFSNKYYYDIYDVLMDFLHEGQTGEVEKRDIGTPVQSWLKQKRDQVQGGPPTKQNVLKTKIKEIVSEILAEMYDTEYAEFSTDTERFSDDTPRNMSGMIDDVVDKFIEYKKADNIDLADDATDSELEDTIYYYLDRMGRNLNDDYYNILFYGVKDELKKQGINFA